MNVSLTPELERFIAEQGDSGHYRSVSEVVRAGARRPGGDHPLHRGGGRPGDRRESGLADPGAHVLFYRYDETVVEIIRVLHERQDLGTSYPA